MRVKVMIRGWQTRVNCNYVLNFHNDACNMETDMYDFQRFCAFLVYKIKGSAKIEHWERNYVIGNWSGGRETKYRGIYSCLIKRHFVYTEEEVLGTNDTFDCRAWRKTNPCGRIDSMLCVWSMLRSRKVPTHHYGLMDLM